MSQKRVNSGLQFEVLTAVGARNILKLNVVDNKRMRSLLSYKPTNPAQWAAIKWLLSELRKIEPNMHSITATGGEGFFDFIITRTDKTTFGVSNKWNSTEINGSRITPATMSHIPAQLSTLQTSIAFRQVVSGVFTNMKYLKKQHAKFSDLPGDMKQLQIYQPIRDALASELGQHPPADLFAAAMGVEGYYILRGGEHTKIMGVNLDRSLSCQHTPVPKTIAGIYPNGTMNNDVTVAFRGGYQLKWRIKNKSSVISDTAIGITLSLEGTPNNSFVVVKP